MVAQPEVSDVAGFKKNRTMNEMKLMDILALVGYIQ